VIEYYKKEKEICRVEDYNNQYQQGDGQDYAFQTLMRNGRPKTKGWSVASMVLGIISVICCCGGWCSIILGIGAIILAIVSRKSLGYFDGMSVAGIVLGIFGFVLGITLIIGIAMLPDEFWDEFWAEYNKMYGGELGDF
jgi:hypothetical protein